MTDRLLVKVLYEDEVALPFENCSQHCTVSSKFSRGFYFRETSRMRSFAKIKPSRNGEITNLNVRNMSFNSFRENKIHAKITEYTVYIQRAETHAHFFKFLSTDSFYSHARVH